MLCVSVIFVMNLSLNLCLFTQTNSPHMVLSGSGKSTVTTTNTLNFHALYSVRRKTGNVKVLSALSGRLHLLPNDLFAFIVAYIDDLVVDYKQYK